MGEYKTYKELDVGGMQETFKWAYKIFLKIIQI